jgi:hypothetical protein
MASQVAVHPPWCHNTSKFGFDQTNYLPVRHIIASQSAVPNRLAYCFFLFIGEVEWRIGRMFCFCRFRADCADAGRSQNEDVSKNSSWELDSNQFLQTPKAKPLVRLANLIGSGPRFVAWPGYLGWQISNVQMRFSRTDCGHRRVKVGP